MTQTTTATTPATMAAATQKNALPRRGIVLLGTFVKPDGPYALIRAGNGRIARVSPGDSVGGLRITAIEPGLVHTNRNNRPGRLRIAGD